MALTSLSFLYIVAGLDRPDRRIPNKDLKEASQISICSLSSM